MPIYKISNFHKYKYFSSVEAVNCAVNSSLKKTEKYKQTILKDRGEKRNE